MAQDKQSLSQRWEDNYPSVLSAMGTATGAFILVRHCEWIQPFIGGVIKLAPSTLNVSAIAVGFLATAQALLLSLGNTKALIALKENQHYGRLTSFFARGLSASFGAALLSALLTAMHLERGGMFRYSCVVVWAFVGVTALLCYARASSLLSEVLRTNNRLEKPTEDLPVFEGRQNDIEITED